MSAHDGTATAPPQVSEHDCGFSSVRMIAQHHERTFRLECLKLARSYQTGDTNDLIERADRLARFVLEGQHG